MIEALLGPLLTGVVCGLIAWGGVRVELRYLRRDVLWAHRRIDRLERREGNTPYLSSPPL